MEDDNKDITQDKLVDNLIQSICGFSDEQLLKEFEAAEQDTEFDPNMQVYPDEFDRIWEDICAERNEPSVAEVAEKPVQKKKMSWKKIAVFALAASLTTASVCFVAIGKKSYFYRERNITHSNVVFNNDTNIMILDDQEVACQKIEEKFKIKPLRLGYFPEGMVYENLELSDRQATINYIYNGKKIYFIQATDQTESSNTQKSDGQGVINVKNIGLDKEIMVKKEVDASGNVTYGANFAYKDLFCLVYGTMEEDEFIRIVERIIY